MGVQSLQAITPCLSQIHSTETMMPEIQAQQQCQKETTWEYIPTTVNSAVVIVIAGKEACMVTFLHHHKCDRWLVVWLEWCTSLSDGIKLVKKDLIELSLTYTIPATMDKLTMNFHMQHLTGSRRVPPITSRCLQCVITALNIAEDSECPKSIQHWYPPAYEMKTSVTHFSLQIH